MSVNESLDVTNVSTPTEMSKTFHAALTDLLNRSRSIRETITLSMKLSFNELTASDLSGKGSTKITKDFLAGSILSLVRLADIVEATPNTDIPINCSSDTGSNVTEFNEYLSAMQTRLDNYCDTMSNNQQKFDSMVATLNKLVLSCNSKPASNDDVDVVSTSGSMLPNTSSPHISQKTVCDPYVKYIDNAVSDDIKSSLLSFVSSSDSEFVRIGDNRDTLYFGEYSYKYNGAEHTAKPMPEQIISLLNVIKPKLSNPNAIVNSCLVTRYVGGSDHIPLHRDNEPLYNPDSEIMTVSIGENRTMKFVENTGQKSEELILNDKSLLIFSRYAQDFWRHGIDKADNSPNVRYSFTFRHLAPHFLNSAIVIGDSNTKYLKFGEGQGTFGRWMPGRRVEALHVENIPEPEDIGPYRNIVIHTGINNIKSRNRQPNQTIAGILENKCKQILNVYPRAKIWLSLLLPTKLETLNHRVRDFNSMLFDISHGNKNIEVIDHPLAELCDAKGCLKDEFGRYDKNLQTHLSKDILHLGKKGLRVLVKTLKSNIVGKVKSSTSRQEQHRAASGGNHRGGHQPSQ